MIIRNKIRKIVILTILSFCIVELVFLPILIDGQNNKEEIVYSSEMINDLKVRSRIIRKKGIFSDIGDSHWFQVALKQDVEYIARMKITAAYGGTFIIALFGVTTNSFYTEIFGSPITNHMIETIYIADGTTTGLLQIIYSTAILHQEFPTYTLYFNRTGFAGWWWIVLSGIGALAILSVIFTFMIMGMVSFSKRQKKGKKKKKK
jgi:hypothetical protein